MGAYRSLCPHTTASNLAADIEMSEMLYDLGIPLKVTSVKQNTIKQVVNE